MRIGALRGAAARRVALAVVVAAAGALVWPSAPSSAEGVDPPAPPAAEPAPSARPRIAVFGDSLLAESSSVLQRSFRALEPWWDIEVHAFPGTAICSWWDDLRATDAQAVALVFTGVFMTDCILGKRAWPQAYFVDAARAAQLFASKGQQVIWLGWPRPAGSIVSPHLDDTIWHYYEDVAQQFGERVADPGVALFDPGLFSYPYTMRCLTPTEPGCHGGRVPVRDLAGGHLCPVPDQMGACPVYSSGVRRYAFAAARAIAAALPQRDPAPDPPVGAASDASSPTA